MTNEELIATAEIVLLKAGRKKQDVYDLQKAINTLRFCIATIDQSGIEFAIDVLLTEIEELKG